MEGWRRQRLFDVGIDDHPNPNNHVLDGKYRSNFPVLPNDQRLPKSYPVFYLTRCSHHLAGNRCVQERCPIPGLAITLGFDSVGRLVSRRILVAGRVTIAQIIRMAEKGETSIR